MARQESPGPAAEARIAIERQNEQIIAWYATGDAEALATAFAEEAWQMPPNRPPLVGRAAIREFWQGLFQAGRVTFELTVQAVAARGDLAVERGHYAMTFTPHPGAPPDLQPFTDRGHYLAHWQRERDGQWRIFGDAPVSELPPPAAP